MQRKKLCASIGEQLRYQILSGEWPSGTKLPPERKLAEEWGVSRNTIVNAYADLESEGLIYGKIGSGRFVKPVPPADASFDWKRELTKDRPLYAPSPITALHAIAGNKSIINFAFGEGGKHTLVASDFASVCDVEQILFHLQSDYMIPIVGHPRLRAWIADWTKDEFRVDESDVMITSGSLEALYLCASILAKPGDSVAVEMPAFFGALQMFQTLGLHIIPIPVDGDGMRVEVLEGIMQRTRPNFIYTNPTFQNPTGSVMSQERRERLLFLSDKYDVPIVEDDAYRHLHFRANPPVSLRALDRRGNVVYIHTFSKLLFPGLRLGWVTANRPFMDMLTKRKELSVTTNTFAQQALLMYLQTGRFEKHVDLLRHLYEEQAHVMESYLQPLREKGIEYTSPTGGFYIWIALPEHVKSSEFMNRASDNGVLFANGDLFMSRSGPQPFIRLSYSHETEERIREGMNVITSVFNTL